MVHFNETKQNEQIKSLRRKEEERVIEILAQKYNMPYIFITPMVIEIKALSIITEETARGAFIAVFGTGIKKQIKVAVFSPLNQKTEQALRALQQRGFQVITYLASKESLGVVWEKYKEISRATKADAGLVGIMNDDILGLIESITNLNQITDQINTLLATKSQKNFSRIFELMLAGAFAIKASDIHIEPQEDSVRIRYRIDGALQDMCFIDHILYHRIITRIKLLSGLKLNITKDTQDGRFSVKIKNIEIEIRTSVLPGQHGESIVMRILDPASISVPLEELGINNHLFEILKKEISKPTGMILTTGPTGAGKTTTLYAFLKKVLHPDIKIITIEDPIEYHIKDIVQTQVNNQTNYTFLSGLRAALRQDPDIIMVGEIRDGETAKIAINAALTGHLVFSSLHTNSAVGTIARLVDLGVSPKVLTVALNVCMAQRLVRKLCPQCKKEYEPSDTKKVLIETIIKNIQEKQPSKEIALSVTYKASDGGCDHCNNSGYKGRIGLYEAILIDSELEDTLITNPTEKELIEKTKHQGILSIREDGIIKILEGITSLEELARVVDIEKDL
ncbi:type II/IV secretion system protein [Patescibacteria group bacterium]|nr:type II/IV secretion system protein [Patescibacteria group bacterium]MBU1519728.1 type II/IV secretion system protein [Patescibacteria group bacterium]MBU2416768.1 type II/IV secretion system protein [Patescibacteria group bacterium]MBU2460745.1 type II/IV secretion system protein [Patescibacteria group bacterium]